MNHNKKCFSGGTLVPVQTTLELLELVHEGVKVGKPVLLEGPVGTAKTSIVEHMAALTGQVLAYFSMSKIKYFYRIFFLSKYIFLFFFHVFIEKLKLQIFIDIFFLPIFIGAVEDSARGADGFPHLAGHYLRH